MEKSADRQLKSRIKSDSESAVEELIEVAESPHIDTRDIFHPEDLFRLLRAILTPDEYTDLVYPSEDAPDDWLQYHDHLYVQIDKLMHHYRDDRSLEPE